MHVVKIKVCGLTTVDDALAVAAAGADWVGLNFHPPSPRYVDPARAAEIVAALPASTAAVGLFVDRPPADIRAIARDVGLSIVQLHGQEPPADLLALDRLTVVRAFRLSDRAAIDAMRDYLRDADRCGRAPDAILVDAYVPGVPGGTGRTIPVDLLAQLPALPQTILAGGLTPENVAERVASFRPWMVDVAGGVESTPGRKDAARVAAFIAAARGACSPDAASSTSG